MTPAYSALTRYGVQIPRFLADRASALEWAEREGHRFPGCRIVMNTARGPRTIWRSEGVPA